jgi:hypothetical protein
MEVVEVNLLLTTLHDSGDPRALFTLVPNRLLNLLASICIRGRTFTPTRLHTVSTSFEASGLSTIPLKELQKYYCASISLRAPDLDSLTSSQCIRFTCDQLLHSFADGNMRCGDANFP